MSVMALLKTGDLITLHQKRDNKIRARRQAQSIDAFSLRNESAEANELFYPDPIPNGAAALYMGSEVDSLREAMKKKTGPFGYRPGSVVFHLVFWNGLAMWVSSEDAELQQVK